MKIAVLGAGIAGMGAALALAGRHEVTLIEAGDRIGGHANTVVTHWPDGAQPVDTGFIVYNLRNYPNLTALFQHLEVPTRWSDMSFGFSLNRWSSLRVRLRFSLGKIFAQRWRVRSTRGSSRRSREILRFTQVSAPKDLGVRAVMAGRSLERMARETAGSRGVVPRHGSCCPWEGRSGRPRLADMLALSGGEASSRFFVQPRPDDRAWCSAQRWRTVEGRLAGICRPP